MNVAVNINLHNDTEGEYYHYLLELIKQLAGAQATSRFYLIHDRPADPAKEWPTNIQWIQMKPVASGPISWMYWYDIKLPFQLRKLKADVVIHLNGRASLTTAIPQLLCIRDLSHLEPSSFYKKTHTGYFRKYFKKFLHKSGAIVCFSPVVKKKLTSMFHLDEQNVDVVIPESVFRGVSVTEVEKDQVKELYTEGKEYFLFAGDLDLRHQLLQLLKAFSQFKKRQRSTWKLVLAGSPMTPALLHMLQTYKYRDDVVVAPVSHLERGLLVAAAYALVTPASTEGFALASIDAMHVGTCVLAPAESAAGDIAGEAGLSFDPDSPEDLADKMMWIYKNETAKKELIQRGREVAEKLDHADSVGRFWTVIMKTAST
jgi:glycosyltransferase involved in cell wall biosynthesis